MELTINGTVYNFRFGLGFVKAANKESKQKVSGGAEKENGARMLIAGIMDGDILDLEKVLNLSNATETPRITLGEIDEYLDDENTDIDAIFDDVLEGLKNANATKRTVENIRNAIAEAKGQRTE